jgi:cell division protein FtsQ
MIAEALRARWPPIRRRAALPRRRRALSPGARLAIVALVALAGVLVGAWFWLRDSSLVAVRRVTVTGVSGADAPQIRSSLLAAARNMTTLDVQMKELRSAVAPYPIVKSLRVSTQFPHGIRIHVIEQIPVGAVVVDGQTTPVAADGTLLHDVVPDRTLPRIPLKVPPGGAQVSDPTARQAVSLLAAAPSRLLAKVSQVTSDPSHGLEAQIRGGPAIYFGDATRLRAKWIAAVAVLDDPGSAGASYIDVTQPARPAAGVGGSAGTS